MPRPSEITNEPYTVEELGEMRDATELEIGRAAFHDDPDLDQNIEDDNNADTSLEQMRDENGNPIDRFGDVIEPEQEPEQEPEEEPEPGEPEDLGDDVEDQPPPSIREPEQNFRRPIPAERFREEIDKRRQLEGDVQRLRGEIDALRRMQPPPPPPPPPPKQDFDPVLDPQGFRNAMREELRAELQQQFEAREAAQMAAQYNAAAADPNTGWKIQAAREHVMRIAQRDPSQIEQLNRLGYQGPAALVQWWEDNGGREYADQLFAQLAEERGYRVSRETATARRQSQIGNGMDGERPRNVVRVPKSLNATGGHGMSHRDMGNPDDLFDDSPDAFTKFAFR
jgi:hypothetical protein